LKKCSRNIWMVNMKFTVDGFLESADQERYIELDGAICPVCESDSLEWDEPTWTDKGTNGIVSCLDCGARWVEEHTTTAVMLLEGEIQGEENDERTSC